MRLLLGALVILIWQLASAQTSQAIDSQQLVYDLANEFDQDPNYQVREIEDGKIEIKRRTPPSKNEPDPEEASRPSNLHRVFSLGFGFGGGHVSKQTYNNFLPANGNYFIGQKAMTYNLEAAVRPPVKYLKRLFVGMGVITYDAQNGNAPEYKDVQNIPYEQRTHYLSSGRTDDRQYFAEWDVLVLETKKSEYAVSAGVYKSRIGISDNTSAMDADPRTPDETVEHDLQEHGVQFRFRGFPDAKAMSAGNGVGLTVYGLVKVSTRGNYSINFGLNVAFGPKMRVAKVIKK